MKSKRGIALGVLALVAGSGMTALPALADFERQAGDLERAAVSETEWRQNLEARLAENARAIAADAMSAASELDLSEQLELKKPNQLLALATKP